MPKCPRCDHVFHEQASLFDAPRPLQPPAAKARRSDPDTSRAAAAYPRGDSQRWRILNAHYFVSKKLPWMHGLTDDELHHRLRDLRLNSLTTRRSELYVAGWLYDTGTRRKASGGVDQIVWGMTYAGLQAFEEGQDLGHRSTG